MVQNFRYREEKEGEEVGSHLETVGKYGRGKGNQQACITNAIKIYPQVLINNFWEENSLGKNLFPCFTLKFLNRFSKGVFNINCPWKLEFQNRYSTASSWEETRLTSARCRA